MTSKPKAKPEPLEVLLFAMCVLAGGHVARWALERVESWKRGKGWER